MAVWVLLVVYVVMSASGLLMIKLGASGSAVSVQNGIFDLHMSGKLLIGVIIYACSFIMSIIVMSKMKLSVFYPVATGAILVLTCLLGYFVLKERIGVPQLVGIALIFGGVIAMNIR